MNDHQWLWYYLNLLEEEKNEEEKHKARLDYLAWWVNPELARRVMGSNNLEQYSDEYLNENNNDNGVYYNKGDTVINNSFDDEMRKALKESGEELVELPSSHGAGNVNESQNDFISRVMNMSNFVDIYNDENTAIEYIDNNIDNTSENKFGELDNDKSLEEELKKAGLTLDDIDYIDFQEE